MSSVPPVRNVIGVLRSFTTSETSASKNPTASRAAAAISQGETRLVDCIVHEPCGVVKVNGLQRLRLHRVRRGRGERPAAPEGAS